MRRISVSLALFIIAGCGELPRDPDGTLKNIRASGEIRVGLIVNAERDQGAEAKRHRLIEQLETGTGATAQVEWGSAAVLLPRLEAGELDLVLGRFEPHSPWSRRVSFATPIVYLSLPPDRQPYRAALAMGENAWITLVENASYRLREEPQS